MPDDPDDPNKPFRNLREPLGELVMNFAHLEDHVTMAIGALLRLTTEEGWVLETLMRDFISRIRLFQALVVLNVKDDDLKKLGLRICGLLKQANSDRNNLLHDAWNSYSPEHDALNKMRFTVSERGELTRPPLFHLTRQLIDETVSFVERVGLLVSDWRARFNWRDLPHAARAPLPDRWYKGSPLHSHMKRQNYKPSPQPPRS